MCEPVLFVCVVDDEEPTSGGLALGEHCMYSDECADGLYCKDYQDENGYDYSACTTYGELTVGEPCMYDDECADGLHC